jgi:rare lipoprotein A
MAKRRPVLSRAGLAVLAVVVAGCAPPGENGAEPRTPATAPATAPATPPLPGQAAEVQDGYATWYGARFAGRKTASGAPFDPRALTAAHRTLPFGTWVEVTRVDTGQRVRVRITDRGPYGAPSQRRIIDLSRAAAERIGLVRAGVTRVELRVVEGP